MVPNSESKAERESKDENGNEENANSPVPQPAPARRIADDMRRRLKEGGLLLESNELSVGLGGHDERDEGSVATVSRVM